MKVLVDYLEWVKLGLWELPDGPTKTAALDSWIAANAIAEALPELAFKSDPALPELERQPPEPIIRLS